MPVGRRRRLASTSASETTSDLPPSSPSVPEASKIRRAVVQARSIAGDGTDFDAQLRLVERARQGLMGDDISTRIDIFEGLRQYSTLASGYDGSRNGSRDGSLNSDTELFMQQEDAVPLSRQPNDSVKDMLAMIQAHNDAVQREQAKADPVSLAEESIYDEHQRLEQLKSHLKYAAMRYGKKKSRIKSRLQQAQDDGNVEAFQHAEREKRMLNHHIFQEFQDGLLAGLKQSLQISEEDLIRAIRDTYEAVRAHEVLLAQRSHTAYQLLMQAESTREAAAAILDAKIEAINDCHTEAALSLLSSARHATRKSITRFRRLWALDVSDRAQRRHVMQTRLEDPGAAPFIWRAHLDLEDVKMMSELVSFSADKMGEQMEEMEAVLQDLAEKQEAALLAMEVLQKGTEDDHPLLLRFCVIIAEDLTLRMESRHVFREDYKVNDSHVKDA